MTQSSPTLTRPGTCPVCGVRFRSAPTCSRCGTDLEPLMRIAARAWAARERSRSALGAGDLPAPSNGMPGAAPLVSLSSRKQLLPTGVKNVNRAAPATAPQYSATGTGSVQRVPVGPRTSGPNEITPGRAICEHDITSQSRTGQHQAMSGRFYARRTSGGHWHHRIAGGDPAAGPEQRTKPGPHGPMRQQPAAGCHGDAVIYIRQQGQTAPVVRKPRRQDLSQGLLLVQ